MTTALDDLRYPLGRFKAELPVTPDRREAAVRAIEELPTRLRAAVAGLSDAQLDTPYRPDGWTVRQVTHHVADSHVNAYVRAKLALTTDGPTIIPYDEHAWAGLPDSRLPVGVSLDLLEALHIRWDRLVRSLSSEQLARWFFHPETNSRNSIDLQLQMYAWHSRHHVAHITRLRERNGW